MTQPGQSDNERNTMETQTLFTPPPPIELTNASSKPVTGVPCPHCDARRGELCVTPEGNYSSNVHRDRLRELNQHG